MSKNYVIFKQSELIKLSDRNNWVVDTHNVKCSLAVKNAHAIDVVVRTHTTDAHAAQLLCSIAAQLSCRLTVWLLCCPALLSRPAARTHMREPCSGGTLLHSGCMSTHTSTPRKPSRLPPAVPHASNLGEARPPGIAATCKH